MLRMERSTTTRPEGSSLLAGPWSRRLARIRATRRQKQSTVKDRKPSLAFEKCTNRGR